MQHPLAPTGLQRRTAAALLLAATAPACGLLWRPSPHTLTVLHHFDVCSTTQAPVLLVLLPGAHMALEELQREGFVAAVRQRGLAVDVVLADTHLGYVYDGSLFERLHQDVIEPARAQGWQRIWLAGISLGGYAAMGYAQRHPGLVEGVVTLAPYLGRQPLVQEIAAAQARGLGLPQWLAQSRPRDGADVDQALWRWLIHRPAGAPSLHLAYGLQDRFAAGHALMARTLPADQVLTAAGGHDWAPWRALWAQWLDQAVARGLWPTRCA